jgi:cytochrome c biogenesis protein CcmG, thiol:disulfide interchange protein DsbE
MRVPIHSWRRLPGGAVAVMLVLLASLLLFDSLHGGSKAAGDMSGPVGGPAPALTGTTLSGDGFDLADHRGHFVLVNLWASWCPPCREEMPLLLEATERGGPIADVVTVGVDVRDAEVAAREFLREIGGASTTQVIDAEGRLAVSWGSVGVPQTYLVDPDGRIAAVRMGAVDRDWLESVVVPLVEASS